MQLARLSTTLQVMAAALLCAVYLAVTVSSAPLASFSKIADSSVAAVTGFEKPLINAINWGKHWIVEPSEVEAVSRSLSFTERPKGRFGSSPIKITSTSDSVRIKNSGSTPRLVRLGSTGTVLIVQPGTAETFHGLTPQEIQSLTIERVPSSHKIQYNVIADISHDTR
ncbi:uncharacterized protein UTRI_02599 [Ustilago trichophora]|uniref:Uncharacterized protein n=1 Tax=Ustilago trichophora TaxID=86804 RepID=A0A5C3END4_9BASI|nr:uncharacterized protein UTRI_02599 [Ustilago trichophora]